MSKYVELDNKKILKIGLGGWNIGNSLATEKQEIEAIKTAIDLGANLIDTAEMYGQGKSEMLFAKAIKDYKRSDLYLVSKVYPYNANRGHIFESCENSLKRLKTDYLDLYLLHWKSGSNVKEVVECMEELVKQKLIKAWGVSNFDTSDMQELFNIKNGNHCIVNQVLYHLGSRGIEFDLLPWQRKHNVVTMAYSPLAQAGDLHSGLFNNSVLKKIADNHNATIAQILLAFVIRFDDVIAIPKSAKKQHIIDNIKAVEIQLTDEELKLLEQEFPGPKKREPLDIY